MGLIHIVGRLVLLDSAPDQYETLVEAGDKPLPEAEAERRVFRESHRTVAPWASDHWDLPDRLSSILQGATDPSDLSAGERRMLAVAIRAGSLLAQRDLAGESFEPSQGLPRIDTSSFEERVVEAAQDGKDYAPHVGGL